MGPNVSDRCVAPDAVNEMDRILPRWPEFFLLLGQYANAGTFSFKFRNTTRRSSLLGGLGRGVFEPRHVTCSLTLLEQPGWKNLFCQSSGPRFPLDRAPNKLWMTAPESLGVSGQDVDRSHTRRIAETFLLILVSLS